MIKIFLGILIFLTYFSCGKPPESMNYVSIFDFTKDFITNLMKAQDNRDFQKKMSEESENIELLLAIKKNDTISFKSDFFKPESTAIGISLPNNTYKLEKDVYITAGSNSNEMLFSLDEKKWFSSQNDIKKNIENVMFNYEINSQQEDNTMIINYKGLMKEGLFKKEVKVPSNRPIVNLQNGMIFASHDKTKVTLDLKKNILFMPAGTKYSGRLILDGNLAVSKIDNEAISLTFMRDIYIYIKGRMISISFNKINWGLSLLSFSINPEVEIGSKNDTCIFFDMKVTLNYKE